MTQRCLSLTVTGIFITIICLANKALCEDQLHSSKNSLEVVIPGLFANSYEETIRSSGAFTIGPKRNFESEGRYFRSVSRLIDIGSSVHFLKYDEGLIEAGTFANSYTDDFSTSAFGLSGFVQVKYDHRISPYAAFGAGYRRIKLKDDITDIDRFTGNVFRSSTKRTMDKFGIEVFGGLRIGITNNLYGAIETDYFTANSALHSVGLSAAIGMHW
jgi:opacity protein-like surface antigen